MTEAPNAPPRLPRSVDDVTADNVRTIRKLEQAIMAERGFSDRLAAAIAGFCGTTGFAYLHVALFSGWLLLNTLPGAPHFDPYPFTFLTLVVSLEAIFLSTFILISQNQEMRVQDRRNQLDLQINLLSEQENTKMLHLLQQIARKVGASTGDDPEIQALQEAMRPEKLLAQIDAASEESARQKRPEKPNG